MVYTDFPDPDIIRVGDVYYMATTTMHFTPGCDILRSYDLVHWEFIAHALNIVADTPEERLECEGANAYGRGMWGAVTALPSGHLVCVGSPPTIRMPAIC